jgi:hypothetical protein
MGPFEGVQVLLVARGYGDRLLSDFAVACSLRGWRDLR